MRFSPRTSLHERSRTIRRARLSAFAAAAGTIAFSAHAQIAPPPPTSLIDANGMDLASYNLTFGEIGKLTIGGADSSLSRSDNAHSFPYGDSNFAGLSGIPAGPDHIPYVVATFGTGSERFNLNTLKSENGGSILNPYNPSGLSVITRSNGDVYEYDATKRNQIGVTYNLGVLTRIVRANGEIVTFRYHTADIPTGGSTTYKLATLRSVTSSMGWMLHYTVNGSFAADVRHGTIRAINTAVEYCDPDAAQCSLTRPWPSVSYTYTTEANRGRPQAGHVARVTNALGKTTTYTYNSTIPTVDTHAFSHPQTQPAAVTYARSPLGVEKYVNYAGDVAFSIVMNGLVCNQCRVPIKKVTLSHWSFPKSFVGGQSTIHAPVELYEGTTSDPNGRSWTYTPTGYDYTEGWNAPTTLALRATDPLDKSTSNRAIVTWAQLLRTTSPVGFTRSYEYVDRTPIVRSISGSGAPSSTYSYDARFNVTGLTEQPVEGSELPSKSSSADYAATCSNPKTCNKPNYHIDARGNRTDFSYDPVHGGLTTLTLPADASGVRPQKRYQYTQLTPMVKNESGALVPSTPVYMLTRVSECLLGASCQGTANERVTTYAYDHNNLLMTSMTVAAGDGSTSATTSYGYDDVGNLISEDGPLAGAADTTHFRYDAARQRIGIAYADPDDSGPLRRRAERVTFNDDGQETVRELGVMPGGASAEWANFLPRSRIETVYDLYGLPHIERVVDGGVVRALTQTSYDDANRVRCIAKRMNPDAYASLPNACSLGPSGIYGPDRITRNSYDDAGRLTKIERAVGTSLQQEYANFTYSIDGQKTSEKDANGNLTDLIYDGFNRLSELRYPIRSIGAGVSSESDYETFGYDQNDNRRSWRRRSGHIIGYQYDALNREIFQDVPVSPGNTNGTDRDLTTTYDLLGHVISKRFNTGIEVSYEYNALGALTSTTDANGRALAFGHNAASARERITYPDNSFIRFGLDTLNRMTSATHSSGMLFFEQGFDDLGRRVSLLRGANAEAGSTSFVFDSIGRLSSMTNDLGGTANDVSYTFGYNPAQQVISFDGSSSLYDYSERTTLAESRSFNGLNQDATIAAMPGGFDTNGNLTNDGARIMTYDVFNRLLSVSGGDASLQFDYDPEGRLYKYTSSGTATTYLYDGSNLIAEYQGATLLRRFVHGTGVDQPVMWLEGSGTATRRYFVQNYQGSVIGYVSASGTLEQLYKYSPYGEPRGADDAELWTGAPFRYTGQRSIPEAKLYYYKARVYDPKLGRFLQTDPIGTRDDLNLYAYVANDPLNKVDPTGRAGVPCAGQEKCLAGITQRNGSGGPEGVTASQVEQGADKTSGAAQVLTFEANMLGVKEPAGLEAGKVFDKIGNAATLVEAGAQALNGEGDKAAQTLGGAAIDKGIGATAGIIAGAAAGPGAPAVGPAVGSGVEFISGELKIGENVMKGLQERARNAPKESVVPTPSELLCMNGPCTLNPAL